MPDGGAPDGGAVPDGTAPEGAVLEGGAMPEGAMPEGTVRDGVPGVEWDTGTAVTGESSSGRTGTVGMTRLSSGFEPVARRVI